MQDHAADQLHVEVPHAHGAAADLAGDRERLGQQVVQGLSVGGTLAQLVEALAELVVVHELELRLEAVDRLDALGVLLELTTLAEAEGLVEDARHTSKRSGCGAPSDGARTTSAGLP